MIEEPITDGELERMREHLALGRKGLRGVPLQEWTKVALEDLERLLDTVRTVHDGQGGTFAVNLRAALESRILEQVAGRAELTDEVEEQSFSVHVTPIGVLVDVRLKVGKWRQA